MMGGGLVPVLHGVAKDEDKHKAPSLPLHRPLSLHLWIPPQKTYPCKATLAPTDHAALCLAFRLRLMRVE